MSDMEREQITEIKHDVELINLTLIGDEKRGIMGIVPMLQQHMADSKANHTALLQEFKTFKRDIVKDYADNFNRVEEKQKWTDGRVKVLEDTDKNSTKKTGFIAGIGIVFGFVLNYILELFK